MLKPWLLDELRAAGARTDGLSWGEAQPMSVVTEDGLFFAATPGPWTPAEIDAVLAVVAVHDPNNPPPQDVQSADDEAAIKGDAALRALVNMSPAQIDAWAAANVTDLPSARSALVKLAKIVSLLARETLR